MESICPACLRTMAYDSYFQAIICRYCGYEEPKKSSGMKYTIKILKQKPHAAKAQQRDSTRAGALIF